MTSEEAVARARGALAEDAGSARAVLVQRLDDRPPYWLVVIDDEERTIAVAALEQDGALIGSGRPERPGYHFSIDAARARALAGAPADAPCRVVWFASRASMSPLFALWEVRRDGRPVWVSTDGSVHADGPREGRGG